MRRILSLRRAWRGNDGEQTDLPASSGEERDDRESDALDSNDRIRAEAPNDLETRRRADQLEREIKRHPRP